MRLIWTYYLAFIIFPIYRCQNDEGDTNMEPFTASDIDETDTMEGEFQNDEMGENLGPGGRDTHRRKPYFLCTKPAFFDEYKCDSTEDSVISPVKVADMILLDITKMPFKMDQWLHIDVAPIPGIPVHPLKIKHVLMQISDVHDNVIGRIAEQIPCEATGHPAYHGRIEELYKNPGLSGGQVMECAENIELSYNWNPTVPILNFDPPVEAFYINMKLTMEEADRIQNEETTERIRITTLMVDDTGACHLHIVDKLDGLPAKTQTKKTIQVPIPCHADGPAFEDENKRTSGFVMTLMQPANLSAIKFGESLGGRQDSRQVQLGSREYRQKVQQYNFKVYNVDSQGYLPGQKEKEREMIKPKVTVMRRPSVPLIRIGEHEHNETDEFDDDDDDDDKDEEENRSSYISFANIWFYLVPLAGISFCIQTP